MALSGEEKPVTATEVIHFTERFWANFTRKYTFEVLNLICISEELKFRHVWWKFQIEGVLFPKEIKYLE